MARRWTRTSVNDAGERQPLAKPLSAAKAKKTPPSPEYLQRPSMLTIPYMVGESKYFEAKRGASKITEFASQNRSNKTPAERRMSKLLCFINDGVLRGRFCEQHVSGKWIFDFFIPEIRLAIEIDGSVHNIPDVAKRDREKEAYCERLDITLIRFTNEQVLGDRAVLIDGLRAAWRLAKNRKNVLIGTTRPLD